MRVGDTIGTVELKTADGGDVTLEQFLDKTRIIAAPRYYG